MHISFKPQGGSKILHKQKSWNLLGPNLGFNMENNYKVSQKGWDFRDDCEKFILSCFLHSGFLVSYFVRLFNIFLFYFYSRQKTKFNLDKVRYLDLILHVRLGNHILYAHRVTHREWNFKDDIKTKRSEG